MLICLTTAILNLTAIPLNQQDFKAIDRSTKTCQSKELCLTSFQKREQGIYRAFCGNKQEFNRKAFDKAELDVILSELEHLSLEEKKSKLRKIGVEVR